MSYIGDYAEDYATLNTKFTTTGTDGAPTVLAGTPVIKCYAANETGTEVTTGITLSVDFDGVVGCNNVLVDLSSAAFYATGKDYQLMITTGTVGGTSVVGYIIAEFSIENRFMRGTDSGATAASLSTAQTDLDTLTGSDGATLATTQGNYAPATVAALSTAQTDLDTLTGTDGATLETEQGNYAPSTVAALSTAQTDLDTLTGTDGATLATTQGNYAPATPAQVNTEVLDVLNVDTFAEPAQGTPAATTTLVDKIGFLYKNWRNKKTQTSTEWSLLNDDASTVDHKSTLSDNGTTASKTEIITGP